MSNRGIVTALIISIAVTFLAGIYWLMNFPMFSQTVWLWTGAVGIAGAVISATFGILREVWRDESLK